jgi:hypothetical protein
MSQTPHEGGGQNHLRQVLWSWSWYHKEHRRGRREPEELTGEGVADAESHHPKVVVWCRGGS